MNLRSVILGGAIFILTLAVSIYGTNILFSEPQYEDFCPNTLWEANPLNESACFDLGGNWVYYDYVKSINQTGYCDKDYSCRQAYELANERHSMNVFLVSIIFGTLLLLGGFYFFSLESVGVGIMLGGVGTLIRGVSSYWRYSEDWLRFLISLFSLAIVVYFSYKFSNK